MKLTNEIDLYCGLVIVSSNSGPLLCGPNNVYAFSLVLVRVELTIDPELSWYLRIAYSRGLSGFLSIDFNFFM